jgi:hypothetical protein
MCGTVASACGMCGLLRCPADHIMDRPAAGPARSQRRSCVEFQDAPHLSGSETCCRRATGCRQSTLESIGNEASE